MVSLLFLYCDNSPGELCRIDGGRAGGGDGAVGKVVDAGLAVGIGGGGRGVGDEGAAGWLDDDGAGAGEGVVSVADGVEIDPEVDSDLAHGRHLFAGLQ